MDFPLILGVGKRGYCQTYKAFADSWWSSIWYCITFYNGCPLF